MGRGSLIVTLVLGFRGMGAPQVEKGQLLGQENLAHILALQLSVVGLSPGPPGHLLTFLSCEVGSLGCCSPDGVGEVLVWVSWGSADLGLPAPSPPGRVGHRGKAGLQPRPAVGFICSIIRSFFY